MVQPTDSPEDQQGQHFSENGTTAIDGEDTRAINSDLEAQSRPKSTRTALGQLSGATYLQHGLSFHSTPDLCDIRSGLGLENVSLARTSDAQQLQSNDQRSQLAELCPKRSEVLRSVASTLS